MYTLYCSYDERTGWRIRHIFQYQLTTRPSTVEFHGQKLLCISVLPGQYKRGRFCNPRKLVAAALNKIQSKTNKALELA